ncbi:hypothetical protein QOZ80_2BG0204420 [Eleusine coracana subsp. coracana]|nr:hypothetical protein QOZ80_2BG0204420 [Eleusine coracana subsp. coracana]
MHGVKTAIELGVEEKLSPGWWPIPAKKMFAIEGEAKQNYEFYPKVACQFFGVGIGCGGNGTVVHYMRTAGNEDNRKFPVLAVDVTSMYSWTTSCDFNSPGLWLVSCNSPLCQQNADRPPYCDKPCDDDPNNNNITWGLFNASLARYLQAAADPRQALMTPVWYFCISTASNNQGRGDELPDAVLGLGRGPAGTLPATFTRFSYLMTSDGHTSVWLGGNDTAAPAPEQQAQQLVGHSTTTTIQLISNTKQHPELYYVRLKAIQVDGTELELQQPGVLDLDPDNGTGGVFMSSTPVQPWTYLNRAAYQDLVAKFKDLLSPASPVPETEVLCYVDASLAHTRIPKLALVFDDGAVMELHKDNYWGQYLNGSSLLQCLAILPSPWPTGESMLGSQLQWGWRMTYDLHNSVLQATTTTLHENEIQAPDASPPPHFAPATSAATRLRILPLL